MIVLRLNARQLDRLSEFVSNSGLIFLAGVIAPIFSEGKAVDPVAAVTGILIAIIALIISLLILRSK